MPFLVKELDATDSAFQMKLWEYSNKYYRFHRIHFDYTHAYLRRSHAITALGELGPTAIPTIAKLKRILDKPNEHHIVRNDAEIALTKIQP